MTSLLPLILLHTIFKYLFLLHADAAANFHVESCYMPVSIISDLILNFWTSQSSPLTPADSLAVSLPDYLSHIPLDLPVWDINFRVLQTAFSGTHFPPVPLHPQSHFRAAWAGDTREAALIIYISYHLDLLSGT